MADDRPGPQVRFLLGVGFAAVVVGAFLPWATVTAPFVGTISQSGTSGDGVITLLLGIVGFGCSFRGVVSGQPMSQALSIIALLVAAAALVVAVIDIGNVSNAIDEIQGGDLPANASVGVGLWVTALASGAAGLGAILRLVELRSASAPSTVEQRA